jgi:transcription termination factor Rho
MNEIDAMEKPQKHMRETKNNKAFFEAMTRAR